MLARTDLPIVERPEFRTLGPRIPLPELVAMREEPLLCSCLFLIPAATAETIYEVPLQFEAVGLGALLVRDLGLDGLGEQCARTVAQHLREWILE